MAWRNYINGGPHPLAAGGNIWGSGLGNGRIPVRAWPTPGVAGADLHAFLGNGPMSVGMMQRWSQGLGTYRSLDPRAMEFIPGRRWR